MKRMEERSRTVRAKLSSVHAIPAEARVLEVGSGAHGLIFFFDAAERVGVDPLADEYKTLFPSWQGRARTIAGGGSNFHSMTQASTLYCAIMWSTMRKALGG